MLPVVCIGGDSSFELEAAALAVVVSLRDFRSKNRAWVGACATPRLP
jgi:hypothetical protein